MSFLVTTSLYIDFPCPVIVFQHRASFASMHCHNTTPPFNSLPFSESCSTSSVPPVQANE
jgi:hypothetical protein